MNGKAWLPSHTETLKRMAAVGYTETAARAAGIQPLISSANIAETVRSATEGAAAGWLKLLADPRNGMIIGATAIGGRAEEWISEVSLAIQAEIPVWRLAHVVHPFPTFSEVLERPVWELCHALGRA